MRPPRDRTGHSDHTVLLFLLALFVLVSALKPLWATPHLPWYTPYLVWGGIIALTLLLRRRHRDDL